MHFITLHLVVRHVTRITHNSSRMMIVATPNTEEEGIGCVLGCRAFASWYVCVFFFNLSGVDQLAVGGPVL